MIELVISIGVPKLTKLGKKTGIQYDIGAQIIMKGIAHKNLKFNHEITLST